MEDYKLDFEQIKRWEINEIPNKGLQPIITMTTENDGGYSLELKVTPQQMVDALTAQGYVVWTPEDFEDENKD